MRAFGEHKAPARALCELFGGSLTGNGATGPDRKFSNGMFSLYLDPGRSIPSHVFDADMSRYLDWFHEAKAIPGEAIMTPGEPERASARKTRPEAACRCRTRPGRRSSRQRGASG